jgi:hypothetical protein
MDNIGPQPQNVATQPMKGQGIDHSVPTKKNWFQARSLEVLVVIAGGIDAAGIKHNQPKIELRARQCAAQQGQLLGRSTWRCGTDDVQNANHRSASVKQR